VTVLAFRIRICGQTWQVRSDLARVVRFGSKGQPFVEGASGYHFTHSDIEFWV